jgi:hypothetical protein
MSQDNGGRINNCSPRVARKVSAPGTVLAASTSQARAEGSRMQEIMDLRPAPVIVVLLQDVDFLPERRIALGIEDATPVSNTRPT